MDSINQNQPAENHHDLRAKEAVEKIRELVGKAQTCFFCTAIPSGESSGSRPMSVQQVDDAGNLWFLSPSDSHKNEELAIDSSVKLYFQGSAHSDFLQLNGRATVSRDPAKIKELWEPILKTWFTEGADDPRITVIQFTPAEGYYWDTKHGMAVAGVKMLIGALIGKTPPQISSPAWLARPRRFDRGKTGGLSGGEFGDENSQKNLRQSAKSADIMFSSIVSECR